MFLHFRGKFENSKWLPSLDRRKILKIGQRIFLTQLRVENFNEIALSLTVKEIEAILLGIVYCLYTLWVEYFDEIALYGTVKEIA